MEIDHTPGASFNVHFLTVVPFFRVTEALWCAVQRSTAQYSAAQCGAA
jgi:hypothetical protein